MSDDARIARAPDAPEALPVRVRIEIPRGSFRKVGSTGRLDFLSPLPCPFNYGSIGTRIGLEGDLLDALVLGPRLAAGTEIDAFACGAVRLADRGLHDDKLICTLRPLDTAGAVRARRRTLAFFRVYGWAKGLLNLWRGRPGRTGLTGWVSAEQAWRCSRPLAEMDWSGPPVPF
ncbi:inorganic diphosphatase [Thiohalocapsa sp. ML1]|jgi:inorganic pyrophosphatase|uniref:inorganic diphosphatase n=1 Tax=Thiohalocapsa sp. ML1 TaxID=1431688 RepID=UPI00073227E8|nr:inorganic diphosphatase [Thiohalocapsa sp. ML1]